MKKINYVFFLSIILFLIIFLSSININYRNPLYNKENNETPNLAGSLEGAENILITKIERFGNISGYGLVIVNDQLTIKNNNENPIYSILFGIPLKDVGNLIYCKAYGGNDNSLVIERNNLILDNYEMLIIYFDTPLLPYQSAEITILQSFKKLITYDVAYNPNLDVIFNFTYTIWPTLPYKAEGNIHTTYTLPNSALVQYVEKIGETGEEHKVREYEWTLSESGEYQYLEPFLVNLEDSTGSKNGKEYISLTFKDSSSELGETQVEEAIRNIHITPWGIVKLEEKLVIKNNGYYDQSSVFLYIPYNAKNVEAYDNLGELSTTLDSATIMNDKEKLEINLAQNRADLTPSSKVSLTVSFNLPFEDFFSANWFEQSIKIDLLISQFEYLVEKQTINLIIEGCGTINYISESPILITQSGSSKILEYYSENVSPIENKVFLITYSINLFDLLIRPLIITLIFAVLLTLFILIVKSKKFQEDVSVIKRQFLPINEIREFCSLYEEKNALILEIRRAEEDTKRKKLPKKSYKNLLDKNLAKIEQIKGEIQPFKKTVMEINETFNNIVKKLDVLDAERISVDDSLNLLDNRYKKGRLPSKAAYEKLANDFLNRRKKIDRTLDKYIQQLRSYIL